MAEQTIRFLAASIRPGLVFRIQARFRNAMRVISGKYRSRPLHSLRGMEIRPTADRLRETLFDVLTAGYPEALTGSTWLDLFAGTGAVGIEALSRGAGHVTFVESAAPAARLIRQNLDALGITSGFTLTQADVFESLPKLRAAGALDYVFIDPPYAFEEGYEKTLKALGESPRVGSHTLVIVEHGKLYNPRARFGVLKRSRKLAQGDAVLSFYRKAEDEISTDANG